MRVWVVPAFLALAACHRESADSGALVGEPTTSPPTDTGFPSAFITGQLRLIQYALMPLDNGGDVDGDGTPDNRFPQLLETADELAGPGAELSPTEVNAMVAAGLADGSAAILLDATHADLDLAVDVLWGSWNPLTDQVTVDPTSFVSGEPRARFLGDFEGEMAFLATADALDAPVVVEDGQPPAFIPVVGATMQGDLDPTASNGEIYGVIPVDRLMDQVFDAQIPPEGLDLNGDGSIGADETHAAVMDAVHEIVSDPSIADVLLDDGSYGVSVAFSYRATAAQF